MLFYLAEQGGGNNDSSEDEKVAEKLTTKQIQSQNLLNQLSSEAKHVQ